MFNDTTRLLLGIEDNHITIENSNRRTDGVIQLFGKLDYLPKACPRCGIVNDHEIINYGWRKTNVRFSKTLGNNVILQLTRRNFYCKACQATFLAQTDLVPKHCSISNPTRKECLEKLNEPVSMKHIANELSTSASFIGRQLMLAERDFQTNWHYLPNVILMDEIKSTKSAKDSMSFEFMNGETHELIDILPFRTIHQLEIYFRRFDPSARENVKVIVTDMNYTYPKLTQHVFPNAIVVMDKFHIINALNRSFNKTRVRLMKQFSTSSREYHALKRYWKLLLVPSEQLDYEHFHKWTNFPYWVTAKDVVHNLLSLSNELKQTYEILNKLTKAIHNKNWVNYNDALWNVRAVSDEMKGTLDMLQYHHEDIKNTFNTNYSNGPLEGSNNKIKTIKRASFGFQNFFRFRIRILYIFKIKTKKALITK